MKKAVLHALLVGASTVAMAQTSGPEFTSWMLNEDGDLASYEYTSGMGPSQTTETVNMSDSSDIKRLYYNNDEIYVTSEGLGSYLMGTWPIPNLPTAQDYTFKMPRTPQEETGTKSAVPEGGNVGMAINGIPLFGYESAESYSNTQGSNSFSGDGIWNADAWVTEGSTMDDVGGGHPTDAGQYHYHATPLALFGDISEGHSPIIGYAPDGYPVYGPYGYDEPLNASSTVVRIESSYTYRNITQRTSLPDGTVLQPNQYGPAVDQNDFPLGTFVEDYEYIASSGHLDQYNGRYCITPEYPSGTYAYFTTVDANDDPAYPYIFADEYYGVVSSNNIGRETLPSSGLTLYDPSTTALEGDKVINVTMSPNPVANVLSIESVESIDVVKVISSTGITLVETTLTYIDFSSLDAGVYIVKVISGDMVVSKKIVKE